jgi:hypothetical protein
MEVFYRMQFRVKSATILLCGVLFIGIMVGFFTACQPVNLAPANTGGRFAIKGSVTKSDSGSPAVSASVQLKKDNKNKGKAVMTDSAGSFVISKIAAGKNYMLEVSCKNYTTTLSEAFAVMDDDVNYNINLTPASEPPASGKAVKWFIEGDASARGEFATVAEALLAIKKTGLSSFTGNKKAIVEINGKLTAAAVYDNSMVSIAGAGYPHIVLRGGASGGILDAAGKMRVLFVSDNDVTLADNLTLSNGDSITYENENLGGGVFVFGGTFTMTGGAIENCVAQIGGGVATYNAGAGGRPCPRPNNTFTMSGGIITGCSVRDDNQGGGVMLSEKDAMFLSGGAKITGNKAAGKYGTGAGVYIGGSLTMSGGEISKNEAGENGGGVYVASLKGSFLMDGASAVISDNRAGVKGGGVYVGGYGGVFKLNKGSITGNQATSGGGIFTGYNGVYTKTGGTISKNTPDNEAS